MIAAAASGFGLLGHLYKTCRASGVGAVIDRSDVPVIHGVLEAPRDGFVCGGKVVATVGAVGCSGFLRTGNGGRFRSVGYPCGGEL